MRGRPRNPSVDPSTLDLLTLPQVLAYLRAKGRPVSRAKLREQIVTGCLPALLDQLHRDRYQRPLYLFERAAVDRWVKASLKPLQPGRLLRTAG